MTKPKRILNKTQKLIIDTAVDSACHARQSIIFIMVEYLRGKKVSKKMDINHDAYLSKYMELEEYPDPKGDAMVNLIKKVSIAAESKGALIELIRQVITVCINMELLDLIQDVNAVTDSVVETLDTELNELVNSTVSGLIEIIKPLYLETTGEKNGAI